MALLTKSKSFGSGSKLGKPCDKLMALCWCARPLIVVKIDSFKTGSLDFGLEIGLAIETVFLVKIRAGYLNKKYSS
jgi:hypothetical protein